MSKEPAQDGEFYCVATYLPMRRWQDLLPLAALGNRVRRQAGSSPGNIAYGTRANFLRREFRTLTVWRDRASVNAFVRVEPHATAVRRMAEWAAEGGAFAEWTSSSPALDWAEAKRRLKSPTFYYKRPS